MTRDTVGTHRRCCRNCVPQTKRPVASQQVNKPRIAEQVPESSHSFNRQQAQDARRRGRYGPEGQWCRKRVGEQARRVDVEVSVEHGTATNWDDAGKGVDYLIVLVRDVEVDAESGTTATVNRDRLPLIPRKQESSRSKCYDESPRRADPNESATSASRTQQQQQEQQQCSVTYKLTG